MGALLALPIAAGVRMMVSTLRVELPGEPPVEASKHTEDTEAEREFALRAAGVPADRAAAIAMAIAEEQRYLHATEPAESKD